MKEAQKLVLSEYDVIPQALYELLLACPLLPEGIIPDFQAVPENGMGLIPRQGAVYLNKYITGSFRAQFPFLLVYYSNPTTNAAKINRQAELENVAKWLEGYLVKDVKGNEHRIESYPLLTDGRRIEKIERSDTVYPVGNENGITGYECNLQLIYRKEK